MIVAGPGRDCSICTHPERNEIERRILSGSSVRGIAAWSGTSHQAVLRHRDNHLARSLVAAAEQERQDEEQAHDVSLLGQVRDLTEKALALMAEARAARDLRAAIAGVSAATKLLELQGRMLGDVRPNTVNVLISAEFRTVQIAILGALEAFPDAKAAVVKALGRVE